MKQFFHILMMICICLPVGAHARDYTVTLSGSGQVVAQREFDALADDDGLALFHLEFGLELPELLEGLSLELGYETGTRSQHLFAGDDPWLSTHLELHGLTLSVAYRMPVTTWLNATARAGGTLDFARLYLTGPDGVLIEDWANAKVGGFGTLGLEIALPRNLWKRWLSRPEADPNEGFTMGLRMEIGWALRQPFSYDEMRTPVPGNEDEAKLQIDRQTIDLGDIHLDGLMFRVGFYTAF
jgi:hypothetical protein